MNRNLLISNVKLYHDLDAPQLCQILVQDGLIAALDRTIAVTEPSILQIDVGGRIMIPGLIDVHLQGAGGADILDGSRPALQKISQTLARLGTTGFLATTVVHGDKPNHHLALAAENCELDLGGARILGIHLEGPFINAIKRGGISPANIYPASVAALNEIFQITQSHLQMMTIAPELPGNLELIGKLMDRGVIAAFGHSNATYAEARRGFAAGMNHVTHIFNAMPGLNHREPGPLLAIFETDAVSAQVIGDGVHLHPGIANLLFRLLGPERIIGITDAIQALGLPDGRYFYNEREYESRHGAARYLDGTLIGTALSTLQIALRLQTFTGCSLKTAIDTVSLNPARLLGIEARKGTIAVGKDADLVVLDHDFSVWMTIIDGRIIYPQAS